MITKELILPLLVMLLLSNSHGLQTRFELIDVVDHRLDSDMLSLIFRCLTQLRHRRRYSVQFTFDQFVHQHLNQHVAHLRQPEYLHNVVLNPFRRLVLDADRVYCPNKTSPFVDHALFNYACR